MHMAMPEMVNKHNIMTVDIDVINTSKINHHRCVYSNLSNLIGHNINVFTNSFGFLDYYVGICNKFYNIYY